jgi:hypothetical protein
MHWAQRRGDLERTCFKNIRNVANFLISLQVTIVKQLFTITSGYKCEPKMTPLGFIRDTWGTGLPDWKRRCRIPAPKLQLGAAGQIIKLETISYKGRRVEG